MTEQDHEARGQTAPRLALSVAAYRDELLRLVRPLPAVEAPLADALGLTLAADLLAGESLPRWPASAMDGYAVRQADLAGDTPGGVTLRVVATVPAGSADDPALAPGEASRIMTGAPVPSDADTVVPVELTDGGTETVRVLSAPVAGEGAHIRRPGEDTSAGLLVSATGTRLGPHHLAAAAATGCASATVHRAPVVAVVSTGDELVRPGSSLRRGQIYESNSAYLAGMVLRENGIALASPAAPDQPEALAELLAGLASDADLVVLTGGVSVGAFDVVKQTLSVLPQSWFGPVAMKPGKPQGWARWHDGTPLLALPGNPVAAAVSAEAFLRPMLAAMQGRHSTAARYAVVDVPWPARPGTTHFMPVVCRETDDARTHISPAHAGGMGSHLVTSLAQADAFAVVDADIVSIDPGMVLPILPLP
ncbi:MAG: molybdopterin molybdotransferase MoeA [Micrococcales bacterium]|nr:molybdopterin molybdotransferase MoeA [Micrococcales bacterium]